MSRVLIVEDEEHLARGLKLNLEAEGFAAEVEENGEVALQRLVATGAGASGFDVVLLDVMLPGLDGFEVVRRLRAARQFVPVMLLTARSDTDDVLRGFEAGADDYLPKPFDLSILLARIAGLLRRRTWLRGDYGAGRELHECRFADVSIDFRNQVLRRGKVEQPLTVMEATLLGYLVRNAGETVSRKALLEEVWGVRHDTDTRTVDNFIARLRRYIEAKPARPRHLVTVRGVGYRFVENPDGDG